MNQKTDELVMDIIKYLKTWGMWRDTAIMANGNRYVYSKEIGETYNGESNVTVMYDIDPEDYTTGLTGVKDEEGKYIRKSFANPEHILDMVYVGPLYMLLKHGEYEVNPKDISDEAWETIFEYTDILEDYLFDKYDCSSADELYFQILEDKTENDDYNAWDPMVFDTWEDYQEFMIGEAYEDFDEANKIPNFERYGTYAEYIEDMEYIENLTIEDVMPIWNKMVKGAKETIIRNAREKKDGLINIPEIAYYVKKGFNSIFDKYDLWYDFGFGWSLTCYRYDNC